MQKVLDKEPQQSPSAEVRCQHHWVIEDSGEVMTGTCKLCGKRRTFGNAGETVREQERVADLEYYSVGELKELATPLS